MIFKDWCIFIWGIISDKEVNSSKAGGTVESVVYNRLSTAKFQLSTYFLLFEQTSVSFVHIRYN